MSFFCVLYVFFYYSTYQKHKKRKRQHLKYKDPPDAADRCTEVLNQLKATVKENVEIQGLDRLVKTPGNEGKEVICFYLHQEENPGVGSKGAVVRLVAKEELDSEAIVEKIKTLGRLLCMQIVLF